MKEEILQQLYAVISALNSVSVSGKNNLANLSGSIAVVEQIAETLTSCEVEKNDD